MLLLLSPMVRFSHMRVCLAKARQSCNFCTVSESKRGGLEGALETHGCIWHYAPAERVDVGAGGEGGEMLRCWSHQQTSCPTTWEGKLFRPCMRIPPLFAMPSWSFAMPQVTARIGRETRKLVATNCCNEKVRDTVKPEETHHCETKEKAQRAMW